jgi:hypothetical protein
LNLVTRTSPLPKGKIGQSLGHILYTQMWA